MRRLPDVAAAADPCSGWDVYTGGAISVAVGTSAATPLWAASMALVAEYAGPQGARQLEFVDPVLYAMAARPQQAPAFHDITIGANRYNPASRVAGSREPRPQRACVTRKSAPSARIAARSMTSPER